VCPLRFDDTSRGPLSPPNDRAPEHPGLAGFAIEGIDEAATYMKSSHEPRYLRTTCWMTP
jgi:hypothetical protein